MAKVSPEWHQEAFRLRKGPYFYSQARIAKELGRSHACVAWALDENNFRERSRARKLKERGKAPPPTAIVRPVIPPSQPASKPSVETFVIARKQGQPPRKIIDYDALKAILAERRGDIPTAELMRMITA